MVEILLPNGSWIQAAGVSCLIQETSAIWWWFEQTQAWRYVKILLHRYWRQCLCSNTIICPTKGCQTGTIWINILKAGRALGKILLKSAQLLQSSLSELTDNNWWQMPPILYNYASVSFQVWEAESFWLVINLFYKYLWPSEPIKAMPSWSINSAGLDQHSVDIFLPVSDLLFLN